MKVAIPLFGLMVSPRFDCAPNLLLLTLENGKVSAREEISLIPLNPWQRVEWLKEVGVNALICGGIDGNSAQALKESRIQVISWVAGDANEALSRFLRGALAPGLNLCPGPGGKRCRISKRFSPE